MKSMRNVISAVLLVACIILWFVAPFIKINILGFKLEMTFYNLLDLSDLKDYSQYFAYFGLNSITDEAYKMWFFSIYLVVAPIISLIFVLINYPIVTRILSAISVGLLIFAYFYIQSYAIDLSNFLGWGVWALLGINLLLIFLPEKYRRRSIR